MLGCAKFFPIATVVPFNGEIDAIHDGQNGNKEDNRCPAGPLPTSLVSMYIHTYLCIYIVLHLRMNEDSYVCWPVLISVLSPCRVELRPYDTGYVCVA